MNKNPNKLISVILPVFNGEQYLSMAIESVLNQNYEQIEIIIIDDGSTDNSKDVAMNYGEKIKYFFQDNGGPAKARNLGLSKATGDFIAFIDADDIWVKDKITQQLKSFDNNTELGIVIGLTLKARFLDPAELDKPESNSLCIFQLLLGSSIIRKTVFDKVGLLDEDLFIGDDTDWFNRAKENRISIAVLHEVAQLYRIHENNITNDKRESNLSVFKVFKKAKDRKKKPGYVELPPKPNIKTETDIINYWHSAD